MQKLVLYICIILLCANCAQITPLTGGKKDIDPPKVLQSIPENASINFSAKEIVIYFDEYINVTDLANQFIITPQTKELPEINAEGKKLKITFNESLLPNTTYKLAFGSSIIDMHEGNAIQNFEYIFSTGSLIDSLKLTGTVISAINKKTLPQVLIGLYNSTDKDSVVYLNKPLYISKTNSEGQFNFSYLPNREFKLIALSDPNKNLVYDGAEEQIAFLPTTINTSSAADIELKLFKEIPTKCFIKKTITNDYGKVIVVYNAPKTDFNLATASGLTHYYLNSSKDTLTLYYKDVYDTLNLVLNNSQTKFDTLSLKIASKQQIEKQKNTNTYKYTIATNISPVVSFFDTLTLHLNAPIQSSDINLTKMSLMEITDSVKKQIPLTVKTNSLSVTQLQLIYTLKQETTYNLTINKGAFRSVDGRLNDSLSYKYKTTSIEDYAQLKLKLQFPKKENYIVKLFNDKDELIKESYVKFSLASTSEKIIDYSNLLPGNYFIRVVEDANKNKRFDTGNYFLKQQPEIIFINNAPIKLLAGWEIENEWLVK